jgi:hypothetical protein
MKGRQPIRFNRDALSASALKNGSSSTINANIKPSLYKPQPPNILRTETGAKVAKSSTTYRRTHYG